jgi:hypothetical protein
MIVIPEGEAVTAGLKSDFVNIEKLASYYKELDGAYGIHFKSTLVDGILYYDHLDYLSGALKFKKKDDLETTDVTEKLIQAAPDHNFEITVYRMDSEDIYFWASLLETRSLYKDLKSEFTHLSNLIKKMKTEGLTGYIEIFFNGSLGGAVFFRSGQVIHSACFIDDDFPAGLPQRGRILAALLYFSKNKAGVFNVKEVSSPRQSADIRKKTRIFNSQVTSRMLETLLKSLHTVLKESQGQGFDFDIILKKKFIQKAEKYDFLDPFAAEFQYVGGKVVYNGSASWKRVAGAIFESAQELAAEYHQGKQFDSEIEMWKAQYAKELKELGHDV